MSIRPVEFNGMIQNTQGASTQKAADDSRPAINQQNLSVTVSKEAEQAQQTVTKKNESAKESALDPNGHNGSAFFSDEKKGKQKKGDSANSDGRVIKKGEVTSFDIKI
ncbi:MAG: hypothetical protein PUG04_08085 [Lachnospiraceae bacterium]|nr:hypothetical protein [Lachnospiraceae bacterium]